MTRSESNSLLSSLGMLECLNDKMLNIKQVVLTTLISSTGVHEICSLGKSFVKYPAHSTFYLSNIIKTESQSKLTPSVQLTHFSNKNNLCMSSHIVYVERPNT